MFKGIRYVLQNVDINGGSVGGAPAESAPTSLVDAVASANAQGVETKSSESSLLSNSQTESGNNTETPEITPFPEKFLVKKDDGSIDTDASSRKLAEGYNHLAKKMGETGGVVPDSAEGYKIDFNAQELGLPESITPELVQNDADFKAFAEEAHKAGFTNEQINLIATRYVTMAQTLIERRDESDMAECQKALAETWKNPDELNKGIQNAQRAFNRFASEQDKGLIDTIGNNPIIVRLLANVGALMKEDAPARNVQPSESRETIKSIMQSPAYLDDKHPDHAKVMQQVSQYYQQAYGDTEYY
ncbi:MAG: hypothetical protein [Caudoviricetes sp.]|nr:MAG: hypothetical protein [Caudoviricetes sp.]